MALVDAAQLNAFAARMDELSQRASSVLQRYQDHNAQLQSSGGFTGAGGTMNIKVTGEVFEAQTNLQTKFQNVNDTVRHQAGSYTNADETNASTLGSVHSALRYT